MILLVLGCGQKAAPPLPMRGEPVTVSLGEVGGEQVTLVLTTQSSLTLSLAECAVWQDGVMIDTVTLSPALSLAPEQPSHLVLPLEGLESGPVQLTGSLHLTGPLQSTTLVVVDLSGAMGEVTP